MPKDSVKTILCFGDSNTWGANPKTGERYPSSIRWPGALQNLLGDEYRIIEEGLCGRTIVAEETGKPYRTGITHLKSILESYSPLDLVIAMLGTNDVKSTFNLSAEQISSHLEQMVTLIQGTKSETGHESKILIVCPPPVIRPANDELDSRMVRGLELFKELPVLYEQVAKKHNCLFLNAGDYITSSKEDGYHLDADMHQKLAKELIGLVRRACS